LLVPPPKAEEDLPQAFTQYSSNRPASSGLKWCQTTGYGRLSGKGKVKSTLEQAIKAQMGEQMCINI
jgi:hypothetical protein